MRFEVETPTVLGGDPFNSYIHIPINVRVDLAETTSYLILPSDYDM